MPTRARSSSRSVKSRLGSEHERRARGGDQVEHALVVQHGKLEYGGSEADGARVSS